MKFCEKCGKELLDEKFCPACGNEVDSITDEKENEDNVTQESDYEQTETKTGNGLNIAFLSKKAIFFGGIAVLAIIAIVIISLNNLSCTFFITSFFFVEYIIAVALERFITFSISFAGNSLSTGTATPTPHSIAM